MAAFMSDIDVLWADCDPFGIIYYPNFFKFMDAAYHRLLASEGVSQHNILEKTGVDGVPLVEAGATFRSPTTFGERMTLSAEVTEIASRRVRFDYQGRVGEKLIFEGFERRVCVVKTTNGISAEDVPLKLRQIFTAYAGTRFVGA